MHAISKTHAEAARSAITSVRDCKDTWSRRLATVALNALFSFGYCVASRAEISRISCRACSRLTPGLRRAMALR